MARLSPLADEVRALNHCDASPTSPTPECVAEALALAIGRPNNPTKITN